jgi:hypothetical protein
MAGGRRDETPDEQADRQYSELLQELRVAQTGVQLLFAFLLTLAFTRRFTQISEGQKWLYVATLLATGVAAALLIGPVPFHRHVFHKGLKPRLVSVTDRMARGGLAMLVLAINGGVLLSLDVVLGRPASYVLAGLLLVVFVLLWYVVPRTAALQPPDDRQGRDRV